MKHGTKRPNNTRSESRAPDPHLFISKRVFTVANPQIPGAMMRVLEKKGRTYANPANEHRLRGKSALRVAKAARVAARIETFFKEGIRRGLALPANTKQNRDRLNTQWRAAT